MIRAVKEEGGVIQNAMDLMEIGWTGKASLGSIIIIEWRLEACVEEAGWTVRGRLA